MTTERTDVTAMLTEGQRLHLEGLYGLGARVIRVVTVRRTVVETFHAVEVGNQVLLTAARVDDLFDEPVANAA